MARVNESVRYVNLSADVVNGKLEELLRRIVREVEATSPAVVVVKSFRTMAQAAVRTQNVEFDLQHFVQQLAVRLTSWEATTFLVGEYPVSEAEHHPVFTVADGLLWLTQSLDRNSMVRKMQIMKMRGRPLFRACTPSASPAMASRYSRESLSRPQRRRQPQQPAPPISLDNAWYIELQGQLQRVMAVVKVRGSAHSKDLRAFEITGDGIVMGDVLAGYEGLLTGKPEPIG